LDFTYQRIMRSSFRQST